MNAQEFAQQVAEHSHTPVSVVEREMNSYDKGHEVQVACTGYRHEADQWTLMFNGTQLAASGSLHEVWDLFKDQYKADQDAYDLKRFREQATVNAANSRSK